MECLSETSPRESVDESETLTHVRIHRKTRLKQDIMVESFQPKGSNLPSRLRDGQRAGNGLNVSSFFPLLPLGTQVPASTSEDAALDGQVK